MLHIPCPHCGLRNEIEFHYGAEAGVAYPDPNALTDSEWAKYLHIRANPKGWLAERWVHFAGCGRWFNLWRNTVTHEIGPAYLPFTTQPKPPDGADSPDSPDSYRDRDRDVQEGQKA